jgi:hypothetical protein
MKSLSIKFPSLRFVAATLFVAACLSIALPTDAQTAPHALSLHDFGKRDGAEPTGQIAFDSGGNMYGVTITGGDFGVGIVWELTKKGNYLNLHSFGGIVNNADGSSGPDGTGPNGVTVDSSGDLFGTTKNGGSEGALGVGDGILWEITSQGEYVDLHDFGGTAINSSNEQGPDGTLPPSTIALDAHGNKLGVCSEGGAFSQGMAFELSNAGQYRDLHDFGKNVTFSTGVKGVDGANPVGVISVDPSGNLYGTTSSGGQNSGFGFVNGGIIWEITVGGFYQDLHDFGGSWKLANGLIAYDGVNPEAGVTFDSAGNMYGTTSSGGLDQNLGQIWELTKAGLYKDLHDFGGKIIRSNGSAGPDGGLSFAPVVFDSRGNLFGTTLERSLVWGLTPAGQYVDLHDFGGTAATSYGFPGEDGVVSVTGVSLDSEGNIYGVAKEGGNGFNGGPPRGMIWEKTRAGIYTDLHDFGGTLPDTAGASPDGFASNGAAIYDGVGNMFGTTSGGGFYGGGTVWEILSSGQYSVLHDFGGQTLNTNGKLGLDGGAPQGALCFGDSGNMYGVTGGGGLYEGGTVWVITKAGKYSDLHDFGGTTTNALEETVTDGNLPVAGVTLDKAGNIYGTTSFGGKYGSNADSGGIVWEITAAGKYIDLHDFGGSILNSDGYSQPDGVSPYAGVTVDGAGNIFGTTFGGGSKLYDGMYSSGILWEITNQGTYLDLHDFGGNVTEASGKIGPDGVGPLKVIVDSAGNIFGSTEYGGPLDPNQMFGDGMVWEFTETKVFHDLHDFGGIVTNANGLSGPDGLFPSNIALDNFGNLYGVATNGGPNAGGSYGAGLLWTISQSGTYRDLHDFGKTVFDLKGNPEVDGVAPVGEVAFDPASNIGVVTRSGGDNDSGMVFVLRPPTLANVTLAPGAVIGGTPSKGSIAVTFANTITQTVSLVSSSPSVSIPASVNVGVGSTSAVFPVTSKAVSTTITATITATLNGVTKTGTLTVEAAALSVLRLTSATLKSGSGMNVAVYLNGPAGPGGATVTISSNNANVKVPASVVVPAGQTALAFPITSSRVAANTTVTLTATKGPVTLSKTITLTP